MKISIYNFRAICPVCNVTVSGKNAIGHLEKLHKVKQEDLSALKEFVDECSEVVISEGRRLELNLCDLTFVELPQKTKIAPELQAIGEVQEYSNKKNNSVLVKCRQCKKILHESTYKYHVTTVHSKDVYSPKHRDWFPRYSQVRGSISGYSVSGGAPGLGKRK
ncbi:hypothetical protein [Photobacterium leiognathi]|uniref:hypothetical protein n=1 Tax=Photobacterium leiognathi TaxID=553611 RepID=UPI0015E75253|nr:hypothetical protein [Photobacterium leiognathi]